MKIIKLTLEQEFDVQLAFAGECFDGLDANSAAYVSYRLFKGDIPDRKILARTCGDRRCVKPDQLVLR